MTNYKKVLGALTIASALTMGSTAFAQTASTSATTGASTTTTTNTTGTSATTPTAPNTGAGGNAADNYLVLGASALVAAAGAAYLARSKKTVA